MPPSSQSPSQPPSQQPPSSSSRVGIPSSTELYKIGVKSLQAGLLAGLLGANAGAVAALVRGGSAGLSFLVAGLQWSSLGSSFIASQRLLWHARGGEESLNHSDRVKINGMSGAVSGLCSGLLHRPTKIVPNMIFFSMLGAGTTVAMQKWQARDKTKEKTSWLDSKWSPVKRLTEKEYEEILEEKILFFDAQIALIDDHIATLKTSQHDASESSKDTPNQ